MLTIKKNTIGQNWLNSHLDWKDKGHFTHNPDGWIFTEKVDDSEGILCGIVFEKGIRKKDRQTIRINKNLKTFKTKCKKCVSCNKDYCEDLELPIENVWVNEKHNSYKFDKHNGRCSFFVNKDTHSKVK